MSFGRVELLLDDACVAARGGDGRAMRIPILQKHGEASRTAAVVALLHERDVEPDSGTLLGRQSGRASHAKSYKQAENESI